MRTVRRSGHWNEASWQAVPPLPSSATVYRDTAHDDRLVGTAGADRFDVKAGGHDTVDGNGGNDLLRINYAAFDGHKASSHLEWSNELGGFAGTFAAGRVSCDFQDMDRVQVLLSSGNDTVTVSLGGHALIGGFIDAFGGKDMLDLQTGGARDQVFEQNDMGDFVLHRAGGAAGGQTFRNFESVDVWTGRGDDRITTGDGDDTLDGGSGDDVLEGKRGDDVLIGGKGADVFLYTSLRDLQGDFIADFSHRQGDRIDLSAIDPSSARGDQSFTFIGQNAFSATPGVFELRLIETGGGGWIVEGDIDGDGGRDFSFGVRSGAPLVASDFVL